MILPNAENAYIDRSKIVDYLMSISHPDGRSKARFFMQFGFRVERWQELADAIRRVGVSNPVVTAVQSEYGARYTIDGLVQCPDGWAPKIRTVWIVESENAAPRLITAHPL